MLAQVSFLSTNYNNWPIQPHRIQRKTYADILFKEVKSLKPKTLLRNDPSRVFSREFHKFMNSLSAEHLRTFFINVFVFVLH